MAHDQKHKLAKRVNVMQLWRAIKRQVFSYYVGEFA